MKIGSHISYYKRGICYEGIIVSDEGKVRGTGQRYRIVNDPVMIEQAPFDMVVSARYMVDREEPKEINGIPVNESEIIRRAEEEEVATEHYLENGHSTDNQQWIADKELLRLINQTKQEANAILDSDTRYGKWLREQGIEKYPTGGTTSMHPNTRIIFDGLYDIPMPNRNITECDVEIYSRDNRAVVIMTERKDNPGMSVTNASEHLAASICTQFALDPRKTTFIERYDQNSYNGGSSLLYREPEHYSRVTYRIQDNGVLDRPIWQHIPLDKIHNYLSGDIFDIMDELQPYFDGIGK